MGKAKTSILSDEVLDNVMVLFWSRGYFDTSVDEIVTKTGLNRSALYGEFGGKQQLFEAILHRYRERITRFAQDPLWSPDAGFDALHTFFDTLKMYSESNDGRNGCLMVATASEVSPQIASVAAIVNTFVGDLQKLIHRALANALRQGELRSGTNVDRMAAFLTGNVLGLMTLARSGMPREAVTHCAEGILETLNAARAPRREQRKPAAKRQ